MSNYTIIKSKDQYKAYSLKLMDLSCAEMSDEIRDDIEMLELLIDNWEAKNLKNEEMDPIQLLKTLMENHNIERGELGDFLGINKSTMSKILNYKSGLSKEVIRKLSEKFKISQEAFNRPYELDTDSNKHHTNEKMMNIAKKPEHA